MSYYPTNSNDSPLLFIHIPKTAGTSVRHWYKQRYGKFHKCMHGTVSHPVLKKVLTEMPSFAIVRNPYDLVYSWYRYKEKILKETAHRDKTEQWAWNRGFDFWLQRHAEKVNFVVDKQGSVNPISPSFSQLRYLSISGKIMVDHVLKYERIDSDWDTVNQLANCNISLPKTNITERQGNYRSAYTPESKRIVEKYYRTDLEKFSYIF